MTDTSGSMQALHLWRNVTLEMVRAEGPDLTSRQLSLLLTVYLEDDSQTVRGLAAHLNASKAAITRALDTLSQLELIRRRRDDKDKRNVLVQRTVKGAVFMRDFGDLVVSMQKTSAGQGDAPA